MSIPNQDPDEKISLKLFHVLKHFLAKFQHLKKIPIYFQRILVEKFIFNKISEKF